MAREVGAQKAKLEINCDLCHGRKGKNAEVVHILKFTDLSELKQHLEAVFSGTKYCVEFYTSMWTTAHQIYGHVAREKYFPLWLVYLEAHGVEVRNRSEAIMRHRGRTPRQEELGMEVRQIGEEG